MGMIPSSATVVSLRPSRPFPLPPGTKLNGIFEIESFIATGGTAEVYRARTIEAGDKIAIKFIRPEIAKDQTLMGLLRKEAATLSKISHDAVVRHFLFSVDPELACPYLAMELVEGPSLADILKDGPLSLASVRVLQERIGAGLDLVHRLGITHRDISPDNIILPRSDPGLAKLIDFGIARSGFGDGTIIAERFAGKLNFASPEHVGLHGGVVSSKSDIYSFGLTLAAALLGSPIDMGGTQVNMVRQRQAVPDLSKIDPQIRKSLARMLQPDPNDRPDTIADLMEGGSEAPVRHSASPEPPSWRRPVILGGAALALCLMAGTLGWRLNGGEDRQEQAAAPTEARPEPERIPAPARPDPPARPVEDPPRPADPPKPDTGFTEPETRPAPPARNEAADGAAATQRPMPEAVAEAAPGPGRDCTGCPQMVPVPAGSFRMGGGTDPSEKPARTVAIRAFLMGQAPVTIGEWTLCARSGACELGLEGDPSQPASNLSWDDTQQYVRWLSKTARKPYRLPSEAEWEYAARGGTQTRFWWGERFQPEMAACKVGTAPSVSAPPPASGFPANAFGLAGTTCLVAQWVSDCWHKNFRGAPTDGSSWGARNCQQRVLRGGSWRSRSETERITSRDFYDAGIRYPTNGFRVARDP